MTDPIPHEVLAEVSAHLGEFFSHITLGQLALTRLSTEAGEVTFLCSYDEDEGAVRPIFIVAGEAPLQILQSDLEGQEAQVHMMDMTVLRQAAEQALVQGRMARFQDAPPFQFGQEKGQA